MRKRHFLIYYDIRTREITRTIPRTWAKANKAHFPKYTFLDGDHPTDTVIENYLVANYDFKNEVYEDFVITYNFSQPIPKKNGLSFIL